MNPVVDVHNHGIPRGFIERVRAEGARYGYVFNKPAAGQSRADWDAMKVDNVEELAMPDGRTDDLRPRRTDETVRQKDMSAANIDIYLESVTPFLLQYKADEKPAIWAAKAINDGFAENVATNPGKLFAAAHVALQAPTEAAKELERAVGELGLRAVQIATAVRDKNLEDR
jgi:predicted TIM-barrel fold metal-dependent hydrolase